MQTVKWETADRRSSETHTGSTGSTQGSLFSEVLGSNLARCIGRFGVIRGTRLYAGMKWRKGAIELDVPGLPAPLAVRAGTSDREAFIQVFAGGDYDVRFPGKPRLIIDAGANVGFAAVKFATQYPGAQIVAVEPDSGNCAMLERNTRRYPGVRVMQAAVWPRSTQLTIDNPRDKAWSFRVREAGPCEPAFDAVSIPQLIEQSGEPEIDILKLDVEGAEHDLFADPSCDEWLARTNMIFVETHDRIRPGCQALLNRAASRHRFARSRRGENVLLIRETLLP